MRKAKPFYNNSKKRLGHNYIELKKNPNDSPKIKGITFGFLTFLADDWSASRRLLRESVLSETPQALAPRRLTRPPAESEGLHSNHLRLKSLILIIRFLKIRIQICPGLFVILVAGLLKS